MCETGGLLTGHLLGQHPDRCSSVAAIFKLQLNSYICCHSNIVAKITQAKPQVIMYRPAYNNSSPFRS